MKTIEPALELNRSRRSVGLCSGMQSEAVLHGHAEAGQKRASKSAEALLWRNRLISMVQEVRYLPIQSLIMRKIGHVTDVMVGIEKHKVVGVREKSSNSLHFGTTRILVSAKRVKADDDECIDSIENGRIEVGSPAVFDHPLNFDHWMTGLRAGLFREGGEVLLHDMVQEAADALVEASRIR